MAVDERSSPAQTGTQLLQSNLTSPANCQAALTSTSCSQQLVAASYEMSSVNGPASRIGRSAAAATSAGGGRRKQCRPVRLCFTDNDDDNNDDVALNANPPEVNSIPEVVNLPAQNICELCGAESASPEALTAHAETCGGRSDQAADKGGTSDGTSFPTRYHELGSKLMQEAETGLVGRGQAGDERSLQPTEPLALYNSDRTDPPAVIYLDRRDPLLMPADDTESNVPLDFTLNSTQLASSSSSSSDLTSSVTRMTKKPPEMTSSTSTSVGPDAEDFCELCEKHFCNKYYLRKHRHDVHGMSTSDSHHQLQQQRQPSSFSFMAQDSPLSLVGLAVTSEALTSHTSSVVSTSSSAITSTSHQLPAFQPTQLMSPFVAPFHSSTTSTSSVLFQSPESASPTPTGLLPSLTSLMLLNPFASSLALLNSPSFLHPTSPAAAAAAAYNSASSSLNTLAELQKSNSAAAVAGGFGGALCDDVTALGALINPFLPPSADPASMAIDDAVSSSHYCELCRKEFCSAYFLAVHRREKHGVSTSTALSDAIRLLAAGNLRQPTVSDSEMQLGVGAEPGEKLAGTACSSGGLSSPHPADMSRSTNSDSLASNDNVCCLCKKPFPNRYGLVLHLLSTHNIRPEGFGLAGELLQLDGVGARSQPTAKSAQAPTGLTPASCTTSSTSSTKQSDRVSCDICNKEVCNKYFLKTHKMKVHGLDSAAAAVYNPQSAAPAVDSTRCEAARSPASVSSSSHRHQQHDDMRKALLMADSHFSTFASHLDFALKSVASTDLTGHAPGFSFLPSSLQQQQQQPGDPMMTASDIFRIFGLAGGSKQDDPFLSLGPPPPPLSLLPNADLADTIRDVSKHAKPVELKIPKHVAGMTYHHHKDGQQNQQPGRAKQASSHHHHHHGRHASRDQTHVLTSRQTCTQQPAGSALNASDQQLIQSGIDPEAFCELCQKEFCSKYFLRTHRHKIHGVAPSKADTGFDQYRPLSQQTTGATANPVLQIFPGLAIPSQPVLRPVPTTLLPSVGTGSMVEPSCDAGVMAGRTSGGKDAPNATRVTCDVCGKELCNKYFLKTHMAKIHGCTGTTAVTAASGHIDVDLQQDTSTDYSVYSADKCPPASVAQSTDADNGNMSSLQEPLSGKCTQQTGHSRTNGSNEDAASKQETLLDNPCFTQNFCVRNEAMTDAMENGERSLVATDLKVLAAPTISSYVDWEPKLKVAGQHDADGTQLRGKKREMMSDDDDGDISDKRTKTGNCNAEYAATSYGVAHLTEARHGTDEAHTTPAAGVIQFVSRSNDSEKSDTLREYVQTTSDGISADVMGDVADCASSTSKRQASSLRSTEPDGQTTINGHVDRTDASSRWDSTVDTDQRSSPPMQPFIMRQQRAAGLPVWRTGSPAGSAGTEQQQDNSEFAPCQLVLPVVKPVREVVTVEFCVTPASSD